MGNYVIVGNGIAAVGCIEGIRSVDRESGITVVSQEPHPAYYRPLISYYLEGKASPERMGCGSENFYKDNGCQVLYGRTARELLPKERRLVLDDGSTLAYDAVCICTGSSPFVPPMEGLGQVKKKFTFLTLDDAMALEKAVTPKNRVLIVGAGLIGLKCAEGLAGRVGSITVCDLAPRVLPSILDEDTAALVQAHLEKQGLQFLLGDSAASFESSVAHMKSGRDVEFDVLVLAVGVRPNTALVQEAGGEVNRGIRTDAHMVTSLPGVYAAGDCVESYDRSSGTYKILALLPNARMQGRCAGEQMASGSSHEVASIPMNALGLFGMHILTAGTAFPAEQGGTVYESREGDRFKRLFLRDGRLTGFMLLGDTDRAGIYTRLIREETPLDTLNFEELEKVPSLFPFGEEFRDKNLGGVV
jgi:NAD(P)H-nitrite reductase large subunit